MQKLVSALAQLLSREFVAAAHEKLALELLYIMEYSDFFRNQAACKHRPPNVYCTLCMCGKKDFLGGKNSTVQKTPLSPTFLINYSSRSTKVRPENVVQNGRLWWKVIQIGSHRDVLWPPHNIDAGGAGAPSSR